ncbi:MAG TPA: FAD-dependent oxidoreductase [Flavobacterium sp.]|nr:FAD-dependent oxidoreductase [Flavobacterium sp.]
MTDYIIVGSGLAGIALAETAIERGKSVIVFDNNSQSSSRVAAGLFNPVILKRFSKLMNAQRQLDDLEAFYEILENRLKIKIYHRQPILRKFYSVEEQNDWFQACDKPGLADFLSPILIQHEYPGIDAPHGYGEVLQTGYVDTATLMDRYQKYLTDLHMYNNEKFNYSELDICENVKYKDVTARHIIFAEGYGIHQNPYFNYLPLDGTKGELFIIKAPNLRLDVIINSAIFILPLGDNLFKVGATYHWTDKTNTPTQEGHAELLSKIEEVITCDFEILEHQAGVRPTVKDRKPIIGTHPEFNHIHVFNGLGTRGVMLGPYMAKELFNHIEQGAPLAPENDIKRFKKLYSGSTI